MKLYSNNTTGFRGVTFRQDRGRWHAKIYHYGRRLHLGYFDSPEEAAYAYDRAIRRYKKDPALLNFRGPK